MLTNVVDCDSEVVVDCDTTAFDPSTILSELTVLNS